MFLFVGDWQGYHGLRPGLPTLDPTPDYVLISASESNGYTNLQFDRETTTEEDDDPHDVQYRVRSTRLKQNLSVGSKIAHRKSREKTKIIRYGSFSHDVTASILMYKTVERPFFLKKILWGMNYFLV